MSERKIDFKDLVKAGVHFGHQKSRWCPKMAPYIWGFKNDIYLIDVVKTAHLMEQAAKFLESVAAQGKPIMWIGTKKAAQAAIQKTAGSLSMPFVTHRWVGGTLSNFSQVKKSVTKLLHYEDILAKSANSPYTKKELNVYGKIVDRLKQNVGGILGLNMPLGALVVVDVRKEQSAIREAVVMGIPVIALVDTNSDPSLVDYVIPANDDVPRSIEIIVDYLGQAVAQGAEKYKVEAKKNADERAAQKQQQRTSGKKTNEDVEIALAGYEESDESIAIKAAAAKNVPGLKKGDVSRSEDFGGKSDRRPMPSRTGAPKKMGGKK